ncbi:Epoxide hydrolase A [Psilocybe cubensis]|uniref:AB hydrolase-1 domain-containing protein n=2 Tax=Psilocybe cubensis TaxID=181762 RepID=A0A8H7XWA2_PSICU|nr:Epoxide hydrolase A [Psilocybe cubensis]KAH9478380.1 Epoxide hydrolase A [Psilocybe cubensis]
MASSKWPGMPSGIHSRFLGVGDLDMHILEALPPSHDPSSKPPLILLLHGFPELAYSWRKVMTPLSAQGYAVVAPDLRGFGQTKQRSRAVPSAKIAYEEDLSPYRILNIAADIVTLVYSLGYTSVEAVVGTDFGSPVAGYCALVRPDLFRSVVFMSAPFTGPPPAGTGDPNAKTQLQQLDAALSTLDPPRKHYMVYFSTPQANADLSNPPQGFAAFWRTYHHLKSADHKSNNSPRPLGTVLAPKLFENLPHYYVMPREQTMPEALASKAPTTEEISQCKWLTDQELEVFLAHYREGGFQGGLNLYRCMAESPRWTDDLKILVGKQVEIPAKFIGGAQDWGVYQIPGAAETMRAKTCKNMKEEDFVLIEGAGHWAPQEKPDEVVQEILKFVKNI